MRLTLVHPAIGRKPGQKYIGTWQMEPLPAATIAGLTPPDVEVKFYDERMETIPFDEPTRRADRSDHRQIVSILRSFSATRRPSREER